MELELYFGGIKEEVRKKSLSLLSISDSTENQFKKILHNKISKHDYKEIETATKFARTMKSIDSDHPSSIAYFIHALRVATHVAGTMINPDNDSIKTALIHNIFEISGISDKEILAAGFTNFTLDAIKLVTIDRKRQFDNQYLAKYYKKITKYDDRLALIRCLDKLDNLLGLEVIANGQLRDNWLRTTDDFVIPIALSLNKELGNYMQNTLSYMKRKGCNESLRVEYQSFLDHISD